MKWYTTLAFLEVEAVCKRSLLAYPVYSMIDVHWASLPARAHPHRLPAQNKPMPRQAANASPITGIISEHATHHSHRRILVLLSSVTL